MSRIEIIYKKLPNTYLVEIPIGISLLVLMFFTLACSEKNSEAPYYSKVHFQAWYNPQFVNTEQFHGTDVEAQGTASCIKCHDINEEGQKDIPGCFKCHFGTDGSKVPAESDWTHGFEHHIEFQDNQTVCNYCHDFERYFGTGPDTCHDCHGAGESHVLGQEWLDPNSQQFHGASSQEDCSTCHDLSVKCSQCHFGPTGSKAPIGSGWEHGNNEDHRNYVSYMDTCNQCHTLNRLYGNEPSNCHDCHED